jgi:uncharacterized protein
MACDYIRGWMHYCLEAYVRLSSLRPDWFGLAPESDREAFGAATVDNG